MAQASAARPDSGVTVPILAYHRFGPTVADSMTVTDATFAWQLQWLKDNGYTVIPLRQLLDWRLHGGPAPPPHSVVITVDDGHRSVYTDMLPLVRKYGIPVTAFIYPSAISNASYAMTWEQLAELLRTGQYEVQSHTYWHPNFKTEKKRLPPAQYTAFVRNQLERSRSVLETRLRIHVDVLAWPFGIVDDDLMQQAAVAGYVAALSLDERSSTQKDPVLSLPRFLMTEAVRGTAFIRLVGGPLPRHPAGAAH